MNVLNCFLDWNGQLFIWGDKAFLYQAGFILCVHHRFNMEKKRMICTHTLPSLIPRNWWIFSPLAERRILVLGWDCFCGQFFGLVFWQVHSVYLVTNVGGISRCYFPFFTCLLSGKTFPCVAFVEIFQNLSFCTLAEGDQSRYVSSLLQWRAKTTISGYSARIRLLLV